MYIKNELQIYLKQLIKNICVILNFFCFNNFIKNQLCTYTYLFKKLYFIFTRVFFSFEILLLTLANGYRLLDFIIYAQMHQYYLSFGSYAYSNFRSYLHEK